MDKIDIVFIVLVIVWLGLAGITIYTETTTPTTLEIKPCTTK